MELSQNQGRFDNLGIAVVGLTYEGPRTHAEFVENNNATQERHRESFQQMRSRKLVSYEEAGDRRLATDWETVEINTNDRSKIEGFQARQRMAREELKHLFRSANIDSIHLRTDESYAEPLSRFFQGREKRRR